MNKKIINLFSAAAIVFSIVAPAVAFPIFVGATSSSNSPLTTSPTPNLVNLTATKIVCDNESDLPNWGAGISSPINSTTATAYVLASDGKCHLESGWSFQWAPSGTNNPGDNIETAGSPWTTFGVTDSNGKISTTVDLSTIHGSFFWVRESLKSGYIPFTGVNKTKDVSAEFYCGTDILNYDNYDRVDNPVAGNTYYCAAFNALKAKTEIENTCPAPSTTASESTDTTNETISVGVETSLQTILNSNYTGINANTDQKQYQEWNSSISQQISITPKFLSDNAGYAAIFGYYKNGDMGTFVPLFRTEDISGTTTDDFLEIADISDVFTVTATGANKIGFAIKAWDGSVYHIAATQNSLSEGGLDRAIVYNPSADKYAIAFEDSSDWDYNDLVVEVSLSCSAVVPEIPQICSIYSNDETKVIEFKIGENASTTVDRNAVLVDLSNPIIGQYWTATSTATLPAQWIWDKAVETDTGVDKYVTFTKTFAVADVGTSATLLVASDNSYSVYLDGSVIASDSSEGNHVTADTVSIPSLSVGTHVLKFVVKNWALPNYTANYNPAGLLFKLTLNNQTCNDTPNTGGNTIPVITLIGDADVTVYLGSTYEDAGATAWDAEDGNLTSTIQKNGLPVPNALGDYSITYDVQDSKHAMAVTVTRTVHVVPAIISENTVPTVELSADVESVESGNPVVLSWTSTNATSCSIDQGVGPVDLNGSKTVNPGSTITYTITCVDGDSDSSNDSVVIGVTGGPSIVPPNNPPSGSNPSFTTRSGGSRRSTLQGSVLGASSSCGIYLNEYIKLGQKNNPEEVIKLQSFLNEWMGANLPLSGVYGQDTFNALEKFQLKYSDEILTPWVEVGLHASRGIPTGYVYRTTQRMINNLMCPELELPLPNLSNETR